VKIAKQFLFQQKGEKMTENEFSYFFKKVKK